MVQKVNGIPSGSGVEWGNEVFDYTINMTSNQTDLLACHQNKWLYMKEEGQAIFW